MCNQCLNEIEFNNILPTDTNIEMNGGVYPVEWTVEDLVDNNPMFFFAPGVMGIKTLHSYVVNPLIDSTISVERSLVSIIVINSFIKGRPDDRR